MPRLLLQDFQFNICCLCELTSYQLVLLMNKTVCLWPGMYISTSALDQYGTHSMETQHNTQHSGKQKLATHFCLSLRDSRLVSVSLFYSTNNETLIGKVSLSTFLIRSVISGGGGFFFPLHLNFCSLPIFLWVK